MKSMSSPKKYGDPMGPPWPTHSFHPSLFPPAKKAGARKSSPAKIGKGTGFGCEADLLHKNTSLKMVGVILHPKTGKSNPQLFTPL